MSEKALVAGKTGGREFMVGTALAEEGYEVTFTHGGNGGTASVGFNTVQLTDPEEIARFAKDSGQSYVFIGPEQPLVDGLADRTRELGIDTFGPGRQGAKLEGSKAWSATFFHEFGIPQPEFEIAHTMDEAERYALSHEFYTHVAKADGLAAGKGAILAGSKAEAWYYIGGMMSGDLFPGAGKPIVFQRRLNPAGRERSAIIVTDGKHWTMLPPAQDYKRAKDGDEGRNTGGMGAFAPVDTLTDRDNQQMMDMADRTVYGLNHRGIDYRGAIFLGLMEDIDDDGNLRVLEGNARFGDPETLAQVPVVRRAGHSIGEITRSAARGNLVKDVRGQIIGANIGHSAVAVCIAAADYPEGSSKGEELQGWQGPFSEGVSFIPAGVTFDRATGIMSTAGGRLGYALGEADTKAEARKRAYSIVGPNGVHVTGNHDHHRTDIAEAA